MWLGYQLHTAGVQGNNTSADQRKSCGLEVTDLPGFLFALVEVLVTSFFHINQTIPLRPYVQLHTVFASRTPATCWCAYIQKSWVWSPFCLLWGKPYFFWITEVISYKIDIVHTMKIWDSPGLRIQWLSIKNTYW